MKKLIIAAAFAVVAASPAFAASQGHHWRNSANADTSYAYAPRNDAVVVDGKLVGTDPDVFIRESLVRQQNPAEAAGG